MFLSSPWSPPGWMKAGCSTAAICATARPDAETRVYASYALYLSKYGSHTRQRASTCLVTIQNEPDSADHQFPYACCNFNGTEEGVFLKDFWARKCGATTLIFKFLSTTARNFTTYRSSRSAGLNVVGGFVAGGPSSGGFIDGVAFHNMATIYRIISISLSCMLNILGCLYWLRKQPWKRPHRSILARPLGRRRKNTASTSSGTSTSTQLVGSSGTSYRILAGQLARTNSHGGMHSTGRSLRCPILADTTKQKLEFRDSYYIMAHFSRFIPRGAVVVDVNVESDPIERRSKPTIVSDCCCCGE